MKRTVLKVFMGYHTNPQNDTQLIEISNSEDEQNFFKKIWK